MTNTLYIGQKNYSSWSLRPWLALKWAGIPFVEQVIPLDQPGYGSAEIAAVRAVSPNGQVPALHADGLVVWDTLAIAEWAAEQAPDLWPRDPARRAIARSATAEMHSGFAAIRRDLGMNIQRRCAAQDWPADTRRNLERLFELWRDCRGRFGHLGPWLIGERSIADAFFTPVATRLRTYAVPLDPVCRALVDTMLADAAFREWEDQCVTDAWDQSGFSVIDGLYR